MSVVDRRATIAHLKDRQGVDDADISALHGNLGVGGYRPPAAGGGTGSIQQRAQEYFKAAQAVCERDGGRLWGVSVCAPMVIADRRTQTFATSQPAPEGARPRLLGLVNAPIEWGGATWGAYMWDDVVNRTPRERKELFLHELFHGVQPKLGRGAPAACAGIYIFRRSSAVWRSSRGRREIIPREPCSRDTTGCWPQPRGRAVPITAAPDEVESFQKPRPGT